MSSSPYRYRQAQSFELSVEERADLADLVADVKPATHLRIQFGKRRPVTIPAPLQARILEILRLASAGQPAAIHPLTPTLTTQQAADRLGVSRPFVVALIESGKLPATKAGTHRRIHAADLEAYQLKRDSHRSKALSQLMRSTRRLGLGY
jgi:excisionase family DNA binding protein